MSFSREGNIPHNVKNSTYRVVFKGRDVTECTLPDITLEHTSDRIYTKFTVGFVKSSHCMLGMKVGDRINFNVRNLKVFDGIIFKISSADKDRYSIIAYDHGVYYAKNYVNKSFKKTSAGSIIRAAVRDSGLPVASIANTKYKIPEYVADDKSIQDVIYDMIELEYKQTGIRLIPTLRDNKLVVARKIRPPKALELNSDTNLLSVSYDTSIESLANDIIVRGGTEKKPLSARSSDSASIKKYGRMQLIDKADEKAKSSHVRSRAKTLLNDNNKPSEELSVSALGDFDVKAGTTVYVSDKFTGVKGEFIVLSASHSVQMFTHTMNLKLRRDK